MNSTIFATSGIVGKIARHGVESLGKYALAKKQRSIGVAQPMQVQPRDAAPPQADDVQSNEIGDLTLAHSRTE